MKTLSSGAADACSIVNEEKVQIGDSQGVKDTCSNNGLPISCEYPKDGDISCDGPGGGHSGDDLRGLVFFPPAAAVLRRKRNEN